MHNFVESTFGCVFAFEIYSDLLGCKPNEAFFNKIVKSCGIDVYDAV